VALALETIGHPLPSLCGGMLLAERAAIAGFGRNGTLSAGGSCCLLPVRDGWIAVNLARSDDRVLLPAWLEHEIGASWADVAAAVETRNADRLIEQGRLLGLAVAKMGEPAECPPWRITHISMSTSQRRTTPLVLDLTGLWAGPLCCHLLQAQGARVIKVEDIHRPDGARTGPAGFNDLLNAGKATVALDLRTPTGREQLRRLIDAADIVIESSRPRALRQLGFPAEKIVADTPGLTWVGITGYGRDEPEANWIAFGDDAGVAAGLSSLVAESDGTPNFCGDAIADPLTGLHAALAAWHCWQSGGGLVSVSLHDVAAHCATFDLPATADGVSQRLRDWQNVLETHRIAAAPPKARTARSLARPLGGDTASLLSEFGIPC
jgi:hypothetical protein